MKKFSTIFLLALMVACGDPVLDEQDQEDAGQTHNHDAHVHNTGDAAQASDAAAHTHDASVTEDAGHDHEDAGHTHAEDAGVDQPTDAGHAHGVPDAAVVQPGPEDSGVVVTPPVPGAVARPPYNKGKGFFVYGSKLYDANGHEFTMRGVNKLHYDSPSPGLAKINANTVRWNIPFNAPAASNVNMLRTLDGGIKTWSVVMPSTWDTTCVESPTALRNAVNYWVANAAAFAEIEKYALINLANEWGPFQSPVWRDEYIAAVAAMRSAGYHSTLVITAAGCGQDASSLLNYAKEVFESDPEKNIVFDLHFYGFYFDSVGGVGQQWVGQFDMVPTFDKLQALGLPIVIGEFGPGRNIGPSATMVTPERLMQAAQEHGFHWLAWAFDDPAYNADDNWFALSRNGDYNSSSDLTIFGKSVVENAIYGLKATSTPATVF